ncbi:hypothetical protein A3C96_01790 [Candidatus Uhrbacteria bacterium RIFCSPHIGHO2_02_FULL_60_10]|uniref:Uncharacterized protein n=1 Tax=Candidatus Uhrbacteria bacterium RIFCSPHIGHO2_02_FULL_60_10 TaxID=1802392 RepID=A0A1F7UA15_9BACT|nr:MAG: hypothetical protein A3C96_01790 [Candidatus Uhrbacteria bacterium RIFCSPHIGHO2_02_FULL_60_10]
MNSSKVPDTRFIRPLENTMGYLRSALSCLHDRRPDYRLVADLFGHLRELYGDEFPPFEPAAGQPPAISMGISQESCALVLDQEIRTLDSVRRQLFESDSVTGPPTARLALRHAQATVSRLLLTPPFSELSPAKKGP